MAVPADFYWLVARGTYRHQGTANRFFPFAIDFTVRLTGATDPATDFTAMREYAGGTMRGFGAALGFVLGNGTKLHSYRLFKPFSSEVEEQEGFNDEVGNGFGASQIVPAQVAALVWANAAVIGVQSRRYIPAVRFEYVSPDGPTFAIDDIAGYLRQYFLAQVIASTGQVATPVIWSRTLDATFPVSRIFASKWPRTQRRRANDTIDDYQQLL